MTDPDALARENEALRERIATLHAAILKSNASLDLDTVLGEVLDCARRLTGAAFGVIVAVEDEMPRDITFSGLTSEQEREVLATPDGLALFAHLRELPAPARLADFPDYVAELGLEAPWLFTRTYLGTPLRHREAEVGHFFLADKAGNEAFADADVEVLELFASQAGSAIANARSLNREARRIVEQLRTPGEPTEQILEVLSFRCADGREVSLGEIPMAPQLGAGETVRAEELVLSVPDGRSVRTLAGAAVDLTRTEYELLRVLSLDAGRLVTYETLRRRSGRERTSANIVARSKCRPMRSRLCPQHLRRQSRRCCRSRGRLRPSASTPPAGVVERGFVQLRDGSINVVASIPYGARSRFSQRLPEFLGPIYLQRNFLGSERRSTNRRRSPRSGSGRAVHPLQVSSRTTDDPVRDGWAHPVRHVGRVPTDAAGSVLR